ncbi:MAG: superoxide dismutase [bacterium]|nr:superoxide dismutase [bacterium]
MTQHSLPKLPYAYDALEPYIDAKTMEIHHTKHHQGYVDKLNAALEKFPQFSDETTDNLVKGLANLPEEIRITIRNNAGGHYNHSMFWKLMEPKGGGEPAGKIAQAINKTFASFEKFKEVFTYTAANRFGSGWAWLSVTNLGGLEISSTANQDNPTMEGKTPILGLDVWEHAYYLKYQNKRPDYIEAWWHVVNWERVEENYNEALEVLRPRQTT